MAWRHRVAKRGIRTLDERVIQRFGRRIWDADWDICCILDGCRYRDYDWVARRVPEYHVPGSAWSVASTSQTWHPRTFRGHDNSRVALVSANPYAAELDAAEFAYYHLERLHSTEYGIETVPPAELRDHALQAWEARDEHGIDQLVIHFMQPHVPFRSRPEWFTDTLDTSEWGSRHWRGINDQYDLTEWMSAYRDNLTWVLDEGVYPLVDAVSIEVLVTADHGQALGEYGVYGHDRYVPIPSLRRVPWLTIDASRESHITEATSEVDVGAQLRALGYHDD